MATRDQKEQVKSPRCEDEEARLCRSAETAADNPTPPPHPPPWVFKRGIRAPET